MKGNLSVFVLVHARPSASFDLRWLNFPTDLIARRAALNVLFLERLFSWTPASAAIWAFVHSGCKASRPMAICYLLPGLRSCRVRGVCRRIGKRGIVSLTLLVLWSSWVRSTSPFRRASRPGAALHCQLTTPRHPFGQSIRRDDIESRFHPRTHLQNHEPSVAKFTQLGPFRGSDLLDLRGIQTRSPAPTDPTWDHETTQLTAVEDRNVCHNLPLPVGNPMWMRQAEGCCFSGGRPSRECMLCASPASPYVIANHSHACRGRPATRNGHGPSRPATGRRSRSPGSNR